MGAFAAAVAEIRAVEAIAGADAVELAVVGDFRSVVRKGAYSPGDTAVYLPEGAVLPQALLEAAGMWDAAAAKGRLAGSGGDRIKAVRIRGVLSQGILHRYRSIDGREESPVGTDLAAELGVTKYEPQVPASMAGEMAALPGRVLRFDLENIKAFPDAIEPGEEVVATEKLHGTCTVIGFLPGLGAPDLFLDGDCYVASKGLGAKGLVFRDCPANDTNVYVRSLRAMGGAAQALLEFARGRRVPLHIAGETFGPGIQDLSYGLKAAEFRAFAAYEGEAGAGRWLDYDEREALFATVGIKTVPALYRGPYDRGAIEAVRDGATVEGHGTHIREGVVVTPVRERRDPRIGRVALKDVSADYLLRKGKGATEYQ